MTKLKMILTGVAMLVLLTTVASTARAECPSNCSAQEKARWCPGGSNCLDAVTRECPGGPGCGNPLRVSPVPRCPVQPCDDGPHAEASVSRIGCPHGCLPAAQAAWCPHNCGVPLRTGVCPGPNCSAVPGPNGGVARGGPNGGRGRTAGPEPGAVPGGTV